MKIAGIGTIAVAAGTCLILADRPTTQPTSGTSSYPPGCAVAVNGAPGYLPRAGIAIHNRRDRVLRVWLEPRNGLPRVELGTIASGERRSVAHALPAGRNRLEAATADGWKGRYVLQVNNRGASTCQRRYLWRIE